MGDGENAFTVAPSSCAEVALHTVKEAMEVTAAKYGESKLRTKKSRRSEVLAEPSGRGNRRARPFIRPSP